jgi:hypothetical protein
LGKGRIGWEIKQIRISALAKSFQKVRAMHLGIDCVDGGNYQLFELGFAGFDIVGKDDDVTHLGLCDHVFLVIFNPPAKGVMEFRGGIDTGAAWWSPPMVA